MGREALRAAPAAPRAARPVPRVVGRAAILVVAAALVGCAAQATAPAAPAPVVDAGFPEAAPGAAAPPGAVADWTTRYGVVAPGQGRRMTLEAFLADRKGAGEGGPVPPPAAAPAAAPPGPTAPVPVFAAPLDIRPTEEPDAGPLPDEAAEPSSENPAAPAAAPDLADRLLAALGLVDAAETAAADHPAFGVAIPAENPAAARAVEEQEAARRAAEGLSPGEAARRGRELLDLGRAPQAERMFRTALVEQGPTEAILVGLGSAWRQMGRRRQAETLLSRTVRSWPASPSARNSHGATLYDLGRFAEAEAEFRVAAELIGRAGRPIPAELVGNIASAARARGAEPAPIAPPAPTGLVAAEARLSGSAALARHGAAAAAVSPVSAPVPVIAATSPPAARPAAFAGAFAPSARPADPAHSAPPPARPAAAPSI